MKTELSFTFSLFPFRLEIKKRLLFDNGRKLFPLPNAVKISGEFFEYWEVPESDLKDFEPQKRKGRPAKLKRKKTDF